MTNKNQNLNYFPKSKTSLDIYAEGILLQL